MVLFPRRERCGVTCYDFIPIFVNCDCFTSVSYEILSSKLLTTIVFTSVSFGSEFGDTDIRCISSTASASSDVDSKGEHSSAIFKNLKVGLKKRKLWKKIFQCRKTMYKQELSIIYSKRFTRSR